MVMIKFYCSIVSKVTDFIKSDNSQTISSKTIYMSIYSLKTGDMIKLTSEINSASQK